MYFFFQYLSLFLVAISSLMVVHSINHHHIPHHAVTVTPAPYIYSPTPAYHSTPGPIYGHPSPAPHYGKKHHGYCDPKVPP